MTKNKKWTFDCPCCGGNNKLPKKGKDNVIECVYCGVQYEVERPVKKTVTGVHIGHVGGDVSGTIAGRNVTVVQRIEK
jgi:transcription elongation factor Elf1